MHSCRQCAIMKMICFNLHGMAHRFMGKWDSFHEDSSDGHRKPETEICMRHCLSAVSVSVDAAFCTGSRQRPDLLEELNTAQSMLAAEEPNYLNSLNMKYYPVSVSSRAFSEAEKEWADAHSEIRIGYLEQYLPYSDTGQDGRVTGIIQDLIPEILGDLHLDRVAVIYSSRRMTITASASRSATRDC